MTTSVKIVSLIIIAFLSGCASQQPVQNSQSLTQANQVSSPSGQATKSRDGSYSGEVIGKPHSGSKFAKLEIGMQMNEIQELMGRAPDRFHTYESGKRWIPFYFGNDARRMQALYKGEGCLIFTDGNAWGGAGGDLIVIHHDPSGDCYQP